MKKALIALVFLGFLGGCADFQYQMMRSTRPDIAEWGPFDKMVVPKASYPIAQYLSNTASSGYSIIPSRGYCGYTSKYSMTKSLNISYKSPPDLRKEEDERYDVEMVPESKRSYLSSVFPGGMVIVYISSGSIDWSNTDNFTYIVTKGGSVVQREQGKWDLPSVPSNRYDRWRNVDTVWISIPIEDSIVFSIVDKSGNDRYDFTISKQK